MTDDFLFLRQFFYIVPDFFPSLLCFCGKRNHQYVCSDLQAGPQYFHLLLELAPLNLVGLCGNNDRLIPCETIQSYISLSLEGWFMADINQKENTSEHLGLVQIILDHLSPFGLHLHIGPLHNHSPANLHNRAHH